MIILALCGSIVMVFVSCALLALMFIAHLK